MTCSRQAGKSTVAAALSLKAALLLPPALVLLLSPTRDQSAELLLKVQQLYDALERPVPLARPRDNRLRLELANGSRIISLPGVERTVRGYSGVRLLVVDEAARVPDALYYSIRPMMAVSGGSLIALTSAYARGIGWYYHEWHGEDREWPWRRVEVKATDCPRISPAFLAEEEAKLGQRWYGMEYLCEWAEADDALFTEAQIERMLCD
jgi:hypothetical protein